MEHRASNSVWWGTHSLKSGQSARWRVGPGALWLRRSSSEWRVAYRPGDDPIDDTYEVDVPYSGDDDPFTDDAPDREITFSRFSFSKSRPELTVVPLLADRAIVVRPETALYVLQGETVSLYISTPLWARIDVGKPPRTLLEVPLFRPSDTWFGPDTIEGELCYNTRTNARLNLDNVPIRRHRAITQIRIKNRAEDALLLERLRLPMEHLSLYWSEEHHLWTETVTMERTRSDDTASFRVGRGAPKSMAGAACVSGPREEVRTNLIVRPFSMLFHKMSEF